jgi:monoamine oxidase
MSTRTFVQLTPQQMLFIIRNGLRKTQAPKNIIIVGAGMSGLVAASLLKEAGHNVTIIEANERVGGMFTRFALPLARGCIWRRARCVFMIFII